MKPNRNYLLLLSSQFLSAFGDNAILMVILGPLMAQLREGKITTGEAADFNIIYTSLLFVPYVLLAPLAGYLNDRFAKKRWLIGGNFIKLLGTALAAASVSAGPIWLGVGYFIVGIGACVYSPAKYGILPEILPLERLVKANGSVELLTLIAILTGMISGAQLFDRFPVAGLLRDHHGSVWGLAGAELVDVPDSLVLPRCVCATACVNFFRTRRICWQTDAWRACWWGPRFFGFAAPC